MNYYKLNKLLNWITTIFFILNNILNWIFMKQFWIEYWIESILDKIQTLQCIELNQFGYRTGLVCVLVRCCTFRRTNKAILGRGYQNIAGSESECYLWETIGSRDLRKRVALPPLRHRRRSRGLQPLPVRFYLKATTQSGLRWIFIEIQISSSKQHVHSPQIYCSQGWLKRRSPLGSSSCLACLGLKCINFPQPAAVAESLTEFLSLTYSMKDALA